MRVLLDENVDRKLKRSFDPQHTVVTAREHGWGGTSNDDLLHLASEEFDVLVTLDKNMQHQQHLPGYDLAVILISARSSQRSAIEPAMPEVNSLLKSVKPGRLYTVTV
jgi:predicted nuclease of predicted toxin-antitoxin system